MSFLTRTQPMLRTRAFAVAPRAFSTSFVVRKSATEAVKDTVKGVDRAVSDKIVDGIEVGRMCYTFSYQLFDTLEILSHNTFPLFIVPLQYDR
jgi:hypothetical protein